MIDFKKLNTGNTVDTIINPRDLFSSLPNKISKYQYPRDVQSQVWSSWDTKRNDKNIILKMNTGSGKTVVGLVILKVSLNERKGPAVYVVPDNFLLKQVINEAHLLGIPVTKDIDSNSFHSGKEILVCNIHKLVNGFSKFGVGQTRTKIGSIIIDDAHACIDTVENQNKILVPKKNTLYGELLQILSPGIKEQNQTRLFELEQSQPNTIALISFWSWKRNLTEITKLLSINSENDDIKFAYPLLKEHLKYCRCVVSEKFIEITPHVIPTERISSFENCERRIFMTATLVDDSILATHFNLGSDSISNTITPEIAGDIGDRMILIPQELNPKITDENLKEYYNTVAEKHNVVIIVPSTQRSRYWYDIADLVLDYKNIDDGIERLKKEHVGIVILINRYDGIDLPKSACRFLVVDNLPDSRRLIDQISEGQLSGSDKVLNQSIQKIEQGMGRGVRSNDDYCIVFLMGKKLIKHLYNASTVSKFSQATQAQLTLSNELSKQLVNASINQINDVVELVLSRNEDWVSASKSCLTSLTYQKGKINNFSVALRNAFNEATLNQYSTAAKIIDDSINKIDKNDNIYIGYAKQLLAEYTNYFDEIEAQNILISACKKNKQIIKPKEGIIYNRIKSVDEQAKNLQDYLIHYFVDNPNKYIIAADAIIEDLIFRPETSNKFEEAIKDLGFILGFKSERPENDYGRGPDNLWVASNNIFFVIECKNGVTNEIISKHDISQLNTSTAWFKKEYHGYGDCNSIIIHLGDTCEHGATPLPDSTVMTKKDLSIFKENIHNFSIAIIHNFNNVSKIKELLIKHKLRDTDFIDSYTKKIKIK